MIVLAAAFAVAVWKWPSSRFIEDDFMKCIATQAPAEICAERYPNETEVAE